MKRLGNVWDKIVDADNLRLAFRKAARGKRWMWVVRRIERHLDDYVVRLQDLLNSGEYHTAKYKSQTVYEPKKRVIHSLPFYPDRIVHHAILNILGPYWDSLFIHDSYACRAGKGQHSGSMRCMQFVRHYDYVLKCDVSKFYHSIDHAVMKRIIRRKLKDERTLALLDEIIDSSSTCVELRQGIGVPIGNLVSQWLGNLYLNELDTLVKQEYHVRPYVRYCDDFILFSNSKCFLHHMADIIDGFLTHTLHIHLSKCELFPTRHGIDYLGYRHFRNYILLRKSTAKRIKRRMARIWKMLDAGRVRLELFMGQVASARGWLKWANSFHLRLATSIDTLWERINGIRCAA